MQPGYTQPANGPPSYHRPYSVAPAPDFRAPSVDPGRVYSQALPTPMQSSGPTGPPPSANPWQQHAAPPPQHQAALPPPPPLPMNSGGAAGPSSAYNPSIYGVMPSTQNQHQHQHQHQHQNQYQNQNQNQNQPHPSQAFPLSSGYSRQPSTYEAPVSQVGIPQATSAYDPNQPQSQSFASTQSPYGSTITGRPISVIFGRIDDTGDILEPRLGSPQKYNQQRPMSVVYQPTNVHPGPQHLLGPPNESGLTPPPQRPTNSQYQQTAYQASPPMQQAQQGIQTQVGYQPQNSMLSPPPLSVQNLPPTYQHQTPHTIEAQSQYPPVVGQPTTHQYNPPAGPPPLAQQNGQHLQQAYRQQPPQSSTPPVPWQTHPSQPGIQESINPMQPAPTGYYYPQQSHAPSPYGPSGGYQTQQYHANHDASNEAAPSAFSQNQPSQPGTVPQPGSGYDGGIAPGLGNNVGMVIQVQPQAQTYQVSSGSHLSNYGSPQHTPSSLNYLPNSAPINTSHEYRNANTSTANSSQFGFGDPSNVNPHSQSMTTHPGRLPSVTHVTAVAGVVVHNQSVPDRIQHPTHDASQQFNGQPPGQWQPAGHNAASPHDLHHGYANPNDSAQQPQVMGNTRYGANDTSSGYSRPYPVNNGAAPMSYSQPGSHPFQPSASISTNQVPRPQDQNTSAGVAHESAVSPVSTYRSSTAANSPATMAPMVEAPIPIKSTVITAPGIGASALGGVGGPSDWEHFGTSAEDEGLDDTEEVEIVPPPIRKDSHRGDVRSNANEAASISSVGPAVPPKLSGADHAGLPHIFAQPQAHRASSAGGAEDTYSKPSPSSSRFAPTPPPKGTVLSSGSPGRPVSIVSIEETSNARERPNADGSMGSVISPLRVLPPTTQNFTIDEGSITPIDRKNTLKADHSPASVVSVKTPDAKMSPAASQTAMVESEASQSMSVSSQSFSMGEEGAVKTKACTSQSFVVDDGAVLETTAAVEGIRHQENIVTTTPGLAPSITLDSKVQERPWAVSQSFIMDDGGFSESSAHSPTRGDFNAAQLASSNKSASHDAVSYSPHAIDGTSLTTKASERDESVRALPLVTPGKDEKRSSLSVDIEGSLVGTNNQSHIQAANTSQREPVPIVGEKSMATASSSLVVDDGITASPTMQPVGADEISPPPRSPSKLTSSTIGLLGAGTHPSEPDQAVSARSGAAPSQTSVSDRPRSLGPPHHYTDHEQQTTLCPYRHRGQQTGQALADPHPDLHPWFKNSLARYAAMLHEECHAETDEERTRLFTDFMMKESRLRGVRYGAAISSRIGSDVSPSNSVRRDGATTQSSREVREDPKSENISAVEEKPEQRETSSKAVPHIEMDPVYQTDHDSPRAQLEAARRRTSSQANSLRESHASKAEQHHGWSGPPPLVTSTRIIVDEPEDVEYSPGGRPRMRSNTNPALTSADVLHRAEASHQTNIAIPSPQIHCAASRDSLPPITEGEQASGTPKAMGMQPVRSGTNESQQASTMTSAYKPFRPGAQTSGYEPYSRPIDGYPLATGERRTSAPQPSVTTRGQSQFRSSAAEKRHTIEVSNRAKPGKVPEIESPRIVVNEGSTLTDLPGLTDEPVTAASDGRGRSDSELAGAILGAPGARAVTNSAPRPSQQEHKLAPSTPPQVMHKTPVPPRPNLDLSTRLAALLPPNDRPTLPARSAEVHTIDSSMQTMPRNVDRINLLYQTWEQKARETRSHNEVARRKRGEALEAETDLLYAESKIGYADISTLEDDFQTSEAAKKAGEETAEYDSFVSAVFNPTYHLIQGEIAFLMDKRARALELMTGAPVGAGSLQDDASAVNIIPAIELFVNLQERIDFRHQKVLEAVVDRDRRYKRTVVQPLYAAGKVPEVKAMETHFEEAERTMLAKAAGEKADRRREASTEVESQCLRVCDAARAYAGAIQQEVRRVRDGLPAAVEVEDEPQIRRALEDLVWAEICTERIRETAAQLLDVSRRLRLGGNEAAYEWQVAEAKMARMRTEEIDVLRVESQQADDRVTRELDGMLAGLTEGFGEVRDGVERLRLKLEELVGTATATAAAAAATSIEAAMVKDPEHEQRLKRALETAKKRNERNEEEENDR